MFRVVADDAGACELGAALDEIVREGARRMLAATLGWEITYSDKPSCLSLRPAVVP